MDSYKKLQGYKHSMGNIVNCKNYAQCKMSTTYYGDHFISYTNV